jgi:hypothetical protein
VILVTYVNDILITGPDINEINKVKEALKKEFEIDNLGPVNYFLGVRIIRNHTNHSIALIQDVYISKVLKKYGMENYKPAATLIETSALNAMVANTSQATKAEILEYQSRIGSLTYLATQTRPNIAFTRSILSRFLVNPLKDHINSVGRVLQYIAGTKNLAIVYSGSAIQDPDNSELHGYSDSDFAGDIKYRKSTSGYVFFFAGGVISCQLKRQTITALSTTEAEYYALYKAVIEAAWLRYVYKELH